MSSTTSPISQTGGQTATAMQYLDPRTLIDGGRSDGGAVLARGLTTYTLADVERRACGLPIGAESQAESEAGEPTTHQGGEQDDG